MMTRKLFAAAGMAGALAAPAAGATPTKAVGAVTKGTHRVVLEARRTSGGQSPTAAVSIVVWTRTGGVWKRAGAKPLAGTYFWKVLGGSHTVCRLKLTAGAKPVLTVSLLETPSIGCAPVRNVQLRT
jgi:hypothetical protein